MAPLRALVTLPLAAASIACGPIPERIQGEFGGSGGALDGSGDGPGASESDGGDSSSDGGDGTGSDTGGELPPSGGGSEGGDDGGPVVATPALPVPRLSCPGVPCIAPIAATSKELVGRDLVRKAYYDALEYPSESIYASYNPGAAHPPAGAGLLGRVAASVELVNDLITEAGVPSCEDMPTSGQLTLTSVPGVTVEFAVATHEGFDKRVRMTDASGAGAMVETRCGVEAGFVTVKLAAPQGEYDRIDVAWQADDSGDVSLELLADVVSNGTRTAFRFQTQGPEYGFWLVNAGDTDGERFVVHGDALQQVASSYHHELSADPVWLRSDSEVSRVEPLAGAVLQCADFLGSDPLAGTGTACPDLWLVDPKPPEANPNGAFSIAWVALPAGNHSLRDALVVF